MCHKCNVWSSKVSTYNYPAPTIFIRLGVAAAVTQKSLFYQGTGQVQKFLKIFQTPPHLLDRSQNVLNHKGFFSWMRDSKLQLSKVRACKCVHLHRKGLLQAGLLWLLPFEKSFTGNIYNLAWNVNFRNLQYPCYLLSQRRHFSGIHSPVIMVNPQNLTEPDKTHCHETLKQVITISGRFPTVYFLSYFSTDWCHSKGLPANQCDIKLYIRLFRRLWLI